MYKEIILLVVFIGILLLTVDIVRVNAGYIQKQPQIIYRYIPRTFEEEQLDQVYVSDIFSTMFSEPTPWVLSVRSYDNRKQEKINQYFVTQM